MERGIRLHHHAPDAPPRQLPATGRASASPWTKDCRATVTEVFVRLLRGRPDLSRQAAGELGSGAAARRCPTWRWRASKRRRQAVAHPLSAASTARAVVVVATTRPETMLGDVAVAVHPEDARYQASDRAAGASAAHRPHDPGDRRRVRRPRVRHRLREDHAGPRFQRLSDRAAAQACHRSASSRSTRRSTTTRLQRTAASIASKRASECSPICEAQGLLERDQAAQADGAALRAHRRDRRADAHRPVVREDGIAGAAADCDVVASGEVSFVPENWTTTYNQWLENIQDWCISRQLWWGHRIPAWYDDEGNIYVAARRRREATGCWRRRLNAALVQDDDVLDTWFSSALWPFSTLDWTRNTRKKQSRARSSTCPLRCWSPASTSSSSGSRAW